MVNFQNITIKFSKMPLRQFSFQVGNYSKMYQQVLKLCWNQFLSCSNIYPKIIENSQKYVRHFKIFPFFLKKSCQSEEFHFSKPSTSLVKPPFLEQIFHLHPFCNIRGSQHPLFVKKRELGVQTRYIK